MTADVKFVRKTATVFANDAGGVRFIHHQPRAVFFFQRDDFAQRRDVAIHRENAFGNYEDLALRICSRPTQFIFEVVQVIVIKDTKFRAGKFGGVHNASVNQLVENDDVTLADQCGDGAERCGIAGGKSQRGFRFFEGSERFFQFVERSE